MLSERDQRVIWHPYTQHQGMLPPIPIRRGEGTLLIDEAGRKYIDAISSWWVTIHGHAHPKIAEAIYRQALELEQVIFTGFTHRPAVELAEQLLNILPGNFSRIFYSDNGSTAVEVAIKMSIQYWCNRDIKSKRKKILALTHAYHGDTFGAMSVSGRSVFTAHYDEYLFEIITIDAPTSKNLSATLKTLAEKGEEIAAFIYEPLLQAAGGMIMYEAEAMDVLLREVKEHGILCIADEVMTGFWRTGKMFAHEHLSVSPDIMCLSKGLTGGTMALGVTAATQQVFDAFLSDDRTKTLFHGHSFTANPIACAAALASLALLRDADHPSRVHHIVTANLRFAEKLHSLNSPLITNIRCLGTVLAFDIAQGENSYLNNIGNTITQSALARGIYLRPLGNTVYTMPPYCIAKTELETVQDFLLGWIEETSAASIKKAGT